MNTDGSTDSVESQLDSLDSSDTQVLYKVYDTPPVCLTWLLALQVILASIIVYS